MKLKVILFLIFFLISLVGCASQHATCIVNLDRVSSDFGSKVVHQEGTQLLFEIKYEGDNCTDSSIDYKADEIFQKYADANNFISFKVLKTNPGKIASKLYVVLFK